MHAGASAGGADMCQDGVVALREKTHWLGKGAEYMRDVIGVLAQGLRALPSCVRQGTTRERRAVE